MTLSPALSPALATLPGIRHAFFTREGGTSEGLYASLNGGLGSSDERVRVIENRRRMAAHLDVAPDRFWPGAETYRDLHRLLNITMS